MKLALPNALTSRRRDVEVAVANALGLTPDMARDVQREVIWWAYARIEAARNRRGLVRASAVAWTSLGYAELLPIEIPRPGRDRVTVSIAASAVSPGTERARYLRLPNTYRGLGIPGYSAAGTVIEVGPGAGPDLRPGARVAVAGHGARHASMATVPAGAVYPLPDQLSFELGALIRLGIISGQGVSKGEIEPGTSVVVVGAGPVGLIAQRIAAARGAEKLAVIARSERAKPRALEAGAVAFLTTDQRDEISQLGADVVIEATGDPGAITTAFDAAGDSAKVILLGSPRGVTKGFPCEALRRKRLTVIGAHEDTLIPESAELGVDLERREGESFLGGLSDGSIAADDLVGEPIDPREAGLFYRDLAQGRTDGGWFDWSRLGNGDDHGRASLIRPPSLRGRGVDFARRPLPTPRRLAGDTGPDPGRRGGASMRIGLLGCGDVASNNAAAIGIAPNAELTACFDPVPGLADAIARNHGARAVESQQALVEDAEVDAVFISVPHHLHGALARRAIAAGKHVILEKPLAHRLDDAIDTVTAARDAGVQMTVCFPYRYDANMVLAREMVSAGALGPLVGCHVRLLMDKPPPYWIGGYSGASPSDWRSSKDRAGGGVLIMNMSHYLDLVTHLTQESIVDVVAASTGAATSEVEDSMTLSFTFEGGAVGSMICSSAVRGIVSTELRAWGDDGHLSIEPAARLFTMRAIDGDGRVDGRASVGRPAVNSRCAPRSSGASPPRSTKALHPTSAWSTPWRSKRSSRAPTSRRRPASP